MFGRLFRSITLRNEIAPCSRGLKSLVPMIKWIRPEITPTWKPQLSGDMEKVVPVPRDTLIDMFQPHKEKMEELKDVRQLFTIGFNGRRAVRRVVFEEYLSRVRRYESDRVTSEAKLALMTAGIRMMQNHLEQFPKDKRTQVKCRELVEKRKSKLGWLKRHDYKKYEWILDKLNIVHKAAPKFVEYVTRKRCVVRLTDMYCEEIRKKKMAKYKIELEAQRDQLLKHYKSNPLPPPTYKHTFEGEQSK